MNYYDKNYIDTNLYLKIEINTTFQPFTTAFIVSSGAYYYNLPVSTQGILICDEPSQKLITQLAEFKQVLHGCGHDR